LPSAAPEDLKQYTPKHVNANWSIDVALCNAAAHM
jgi:hypothetical protein